MATVNVRADDRVQKSVPGTLVDRIRAEYAEMPGLSITLPQAQRLWAVDRATCEEILSRLTSRGELRRTTKGRFVRA